MKKLTKQIAQILLAISLTSLFWIGYELGERGINADATHTAGYTTTIEMVAIVLSVIILIFSIFTVVSGKSKKTV